MLKLHTCRHCERRVPRLRRRGLCWRCYYTPAIRRQYAPQSKYAPTYGDINGGYRLPDRPTREAPQSAGKVEAMRLRALARQSLWHPFDADALSGTGAGTGGAP